MTCKKSFFYCGKRLLSVNKPAEHSLYSIRQKIAKNFMFFMGRANKNTNTHINKTFSCHLQQQNTSI